MLETNDEWASPEAIAGSPDRRLQEDLGDNEAGELETEPGRALAKPIVDLWLDRREEGDRGGQKERRHPEGEHRIE